MKNEQLVSQVLDIYICMISLKKLLLEFLLDEVTFGQLLKNTDSGRIERGQHVKARSTLIRGVRGELEGSAESTDIAWTFNYKTSNPYSTTGKRYHGTIVFPKESIEGGEVVDVADLDCKVHCDCPDYFYRRQYANDKIGAGLMKPNLQKMQHNRQAPNPAARQNTDIGPGLCKHLVALADFLNQTVDAPNPEDEVPKTVQVKDKTMEPRPSQAKPTTKAPNPDTTYNDTRSGTSEPNEKKSDTYSDSRGLEESAKYSIVQRMDALVARLQNFNVPYEE